MHRREFGYRLLVDEAADAGQPMAARTAWAICSANGWWSAFGKPRRGKGRQPGPPVHDDLLATVDSHGVTRHAFTAEAPNTVWLTDISEHKTAEGKLSVRGQGRALQPDRRLLHRLPDEVPPRGHRLVQRGSDAPRRG